MLPYVMDHESIVVCGILALVTLHPHIGLGITLLQFAIQAGQIVLLFIFHVHKRSFSFSGLKTKQYRVAMTVEILWTYRALCGAGEGWRSGGPIV